VASSAATAEPASPLFIFGVVRSKAAKAKKRLAAFGCGFSVTPDHKKRNFAAFATTLINDITKYSFIDATHCDVATQCDAKNESISKKRPLRELCVLASHCVATSHIVAFKKDIILELFYYL